MNRLDLIIKIQDLYWIDNSKDNPDDLCLHGNVFVRIGDEMVADNYPCTVSSTALYLLKSIENDHVVEESANQMLPCCGFFIIPDEKDDIVEISGCPNGIDWTVLHQGEHVKLITQIGTEIVLELKLYREIVYSFIDNIEDFYKKSTPKKIPSDTFDRDGYIKFWKEWDRRRYT